VRREPQVLVTGFQPFAGAKLNSSEEIVKWLERREIPGVFLEVLPVEYEKSVDQMLSLIREIEPEIILALGQAEGRSRVSFERIAINLDDARIPDNAGTLRANQQISEGGDVAYMANLPVREIVEKLKRQGLPAEESLSAGAFVCNHLFYSVMNHLESSKGDCWMDFIHLPLIPEQGGEFPGKPTLDRGSQGQTIIAAIEEARTLWQS
jgi:pyroglutamyl-peptidase